MNARYVIIGNSAAAVGCIEGIRQIDRAAPIAVVSSESHPVYARPLISYLLQGKTGLDRMGYRRADFYKENNCVFMPGKTAVKLDPRAKAVALADGGAVSYEKLLVAAGSRPFVPPMEGLEAIESFAFMSLDDALALEKTLSSKPRVLIVGAGLIGLKCAEGIAARAASVTVVEMAGRVLPAVLDEKAAALVQKQMEAHGVYFILNDSVKKLAPGKAVSSGKPLAGTAHTAGGKKIDFDALVIAVGVRPNTELVSAAGGKTGRGIVVDSAMRTSLADVWAAGDCAESFDITTGEQKVLALLPNAYFQGETAGFNMAGAKKRFENAAPFNAAGFFGLHLATAGSYTGEGVEVADDSGGTVYKKFFIRDGLLKGFIIIGDTRGAGIYTGLLRGQTPLSSINFEQIKTAPGLMAFSKPVRAEILAGGAA